MDINPLTQLSMQLYKSKSAKDQLRLICTTVSDVIPKANRVSLWKFNADKTEITCLALLKEQAFSTPSEVTLSAKDYPEYFAAIVSESTVVASDARNQAETECFNESYFIPQNIYSLLDYVFSEQFVPFGIICCESVGKKVTWSLKDIAELKRAARIVSVFAQMNSHQ
ncbi:hypothetical protein [Alteromonas flava]|uniref:hypothetical protein n=1 Tax=Alteromonas flava TaxID=2048003 RepID=UPI000F5D835F|nr:hypothetical protein [Alteromonas flava]